MQRDRQERRIAGIRLVDSLERQIKYVIALNTLLWLTGTITFGLASAHQTGQIAVSLQTWFILQTIETAICTIACAWFFVLLQIKTKLQHNRLITIMGSNALWMVLVAQMFLFVYLETRIAFVWSYASQNSEFLSIIDQGIRIDGPPPTFTERLLDKYLDMAIFTNCMLNYLTASFVFVQSRAFDKTRAFRYMRKFVQDL
jgi:hypothetical protein